MKEMSQGSKILEYAKGILEKDCPLWNVLRKCRINGGDCDASEECTTRDFMKKWIIHVIEKAMLTIKDREQDLIDICKKHFLTMKWRIASDSEGTHFNLSIWTLYIPGGYTMAFEVYGKSRDEATEKAIAKLDKEER